MPGSHILRCRQFVVLSLHLRQERPPDLFVQTSTANPLLVPTTPVRKHQGHSEMRQFWVHLR